jgi:hypothetical protein
VHYLIGKSLVYLQAKFVIKKRNEKKKKNCSLKEEENRTKRKEKDGSLDVNLIQVLFNYDWSSKSNIASIYISKLSNLFKSL